ncbi:MAG: SUMF1/EgtB/PvdO family nonheme iron enzyme [Verrucomicrobiaceae bacterium]|nr:SUMF1/EgtB/PvdO family nonheme iron enzyme [Verrucomicrobiaceae bacterium]
MKRARKSTLGMRFVAVPGTTVLVSVWETRVADWNAFLKAKKHPWSYQPHFKQDENHPVVGVNLQDAIAFCNWLTEQEMSEGVLNNAQSYRLPTPDEWDSAIGLAGARKELGASTQERVEDTMAFAWGLTWPPPAKAANYAEHEIDGYTDGYEFTAPVGQFTPTAEGLFDLAGNVWEWTDKPEAQSVPTGTLRGGSWAYFRRECLTSAYRYVVPADMRMPTVGFRCVFDDKQYTAMMLRTLADAKQKSLEERMKQMRKSSDNDSDVEALRQRLAAGSAGSAAVDPSKLSPAVAGVSYMNSLGMRFVPLDKPGKVLICTTETSVRDYEAWLKDARRTWVKKPQYLLGDTHPAAGVSWDDAKAFCQWLTEKERKLNLLPPTAAYRLPADLEWSAAAGLPGESGADPAARHLGNKDHFPWPVKSPADWAPPIMSVNIDASRVPGFSDSYSYTAPTDKATPNGLGLREMGGNVAEWCEDAWPGEAAQRVIRGGSYLRFERDRLLTTARDHAPKDSMRGDLGFRVVIEFGGN